jgi:hypothetical protein
MTPSTGASTQQVPTFGERIMLRQYLHWRRLIGATVQVRQHGQSIHTGTVHDAMPDSIALWIAGDAAQPPPCTKPYAGSRCGRNRIKPKTGSATASHPPHQHITDLAGRPMHQSIYKCQSTRNNSSPELSDAFQNFIPERNIPAENRLPSSTRSSAPRPRMSPGPQTSCTTSKPTAASSVTASTCTAWASSQNHGGERGSWPDTQATSAPVSRPLDRHRSVSYRYLVGEGES